MGDREHAEGSAGVEDGQTQQAQAHDGWNIVTTVTVAPLSGCPATAIYLLYQPAFVVGVALFVLGIVLMATGTWYLVQAF